MRKILGIVLVMVFLASAVPLAITPAAAMGQYEKKIPGDADENDELTKAELTSAILPYMLEEGAYTLDDIGDAAYVYAYWNGEPKKFVDDANREVTFYRPIEQIVAASPNTVKTIIALGACDKLVATTHYGKQCQCSVLAGTICTANVCGGRLFELPVVGPSSRITCLELVVSLKPDLIFDRSSSADATEEKTGCPTVVISSSGFDLDTLYKEIETMGVLLEKEQEAEELTSLIQEKVDKVRKVTSQIPEHEKPRVYFATRGYISSYGGMWGFTSTTGHYYPLDMAGGINVAEGISGSKVSSKEQIIAWNPDIIIARYSTKEGDVPDPVECILSDPDLQTMDAVKNGTVYYAMSVYCLGTPQDRSLAHMMYLAKLLHPDKFEDLDVEKEGNEIMEAFLGVDGLFSEYADYTGWMREWLDEQQKS